MSELLSKSDIFVSTVAALKNDAAGIADFIARTHRVLEANYTNYEIVLIDRASDDGTMAEVDRALRRHRCVRVLSLSGESDIELALMAGLDAAIGDFVVTLLPGMDPPELIPAMVREARTGHDVVLGICDDALRKGSLYRALRSVFHTLARRWIRGKLIPGATAFRVLSRQAVNALIQVRARRRYFVPLLIEIGFNLGQVPYHTESTRPEARIGVLGSVRRGLSVLIHNSSLPLRLVSVLGLVGSALSVLYAIYVVVINLVKSQITEGWTTLSLQSSGLFLLVFLMLTLLGEYMARLLEESTERPLYHVRGERASSVMINDSARTNVMETSIREDGKDGKDGKDAKDGKNGKVAFADKAQNK